jgi:hypothetical protein
LPELGAILGGEDRRGAWSHDRRLEEITWVMEMEEAGIEDGK